MDILAGATDFYIAKLESNEILHNYDVNSLYSKAMLNPMPYEIINFYPDMSNIKLEDFFYKFIAHVSRMREKHRKFS